MGELYVLLKKAVEKGEIPQYRYDHYQYIFGRKLKTESRGIKKMIKIAPSILSADFSRLGGGN